MAKVINEIEEFRLKHNLTIRQMAFLWGAQEHQMGVWCRGKEPGNMAKRILELLELSDWLPEMIADAKQEWPNNPGRKKKATTINNNC